MSLISRRRPSVDTPDDIVIIVSHWKLNGKSAITRTRQTLRPKQRRRVPATRNEKNGHPCCVSFAHSKIMACRVRAALRLRYRMMGREKILQGGNNKTFETFTADMLQVSRLGRVGPGRAGASPRRCRIWFEDGSRARAFASSGEKRGKVAHTVSD